MYIIYAGVTHCHLILGQRCDQGDQGDQGEPDQLSQNPKNTFSTDKLTSNLGHYPKALSQQISRLKTFIEDQDRLEPGITSKTSSTCNKSSQVDL